MKLRTFQTNVFLLLLAVLSISGDAGNIISCTTPGKVFVGDTAAVTCSFNQNVESNKQDFYIYRTREVGNEPVIVAICAWEENSLSCDFKHGCNAKVQNHTVILNISSAQLTHAGNYTCTTLPPAPDTTLEKCSLSVQETLTNKISIFCNKDRRQTSVTCVFPENLDASHIILERHDFTRSTKPVAVMHCDTNKETCSSALVGYQTIIDTNEADNFKTFGVIIPPFTADKSGLYVCKADDESTSLDMCTLKNDRDDTGPEPVEEALGEALHLLLVPLYAIVSCLVMLVVLVLVFVIKRCRKNVRNRSRDQRSGPSRDAFSSLLLNDGACETTRTVC
ncbi:uncharacterized protein [Littorina saxatilis]|uniref:Immunoglobulin V-set domain-containing protein n=1 Tax=Littorina saxatilis TaxID=31220 RepID=A0AAN9BI87_9CAEN